jgi:molecular chaperone HtpG
MTEASAPHAESYAFKAEIKQLLNILVHSLYKERDIFLRELISNAADALTRIHFEMLTDPDVVDPEAELAIHIEVIDSEEGKSLVIKDTGIGMSADELIENLGTIAQSGARAFLERIRESDISPGEIIGQFGVGFYSVFMVADEVRVVSRSYRQDDQAAAWVSRGGEAFRIEPAEKSGRGTEIHVSLKADAQEFADEWRLRQTVKKYSDFVGYPIYVAEEQANQQEPLWRKTPADVKEDEYQKFYQQMTMDFEEPLLVIHLSSDAPLHLRSLLFVPASRERGVLSLRKEPGLKLYSHNVLIQEYSEDLLPRWLSFVDGVADSEDVPLNVSRESIQNTRILRQLGKTLRKRILRELNDLADSRPEDYARFWEQYSSILKEGLATDSEARDDLLPLFRFYSTRSGEGLTSLDQYVKGMAQEQEEIYYLLGDNRESIGFSPHLDPFKARGLEVLYLVDPIDPFVAPSLSAYRDKPLRNIDDVELELPEDEEGAAHDDRAQPIEEPDFNRLVGRFVTTLGDRIIEVREGKRLLSSPARLVSPEGSPDRDLQRVYKYLNREYTVPKRIFEVNRRHSLIANLAALVAERPNEPLIDLTIEQLYESALLQEGLHPDPVAMLPRIQSLLALAARMATEPSSPRSE